MRITWEKIICSHIQVGQIEKLELYPVDIKGLGQRSNVITTYAVGQVCQCSEERRIEERRLSRRPL